MSKLCEDCSKQVEIHDEMLTDLSILAAALYSIERGFMVQAKEEIGMLQKRMVRRHHKMVDRDIDNA